MNIKFNKVYTFFILGVFFSETVVTSLNIVSRHDFEVTSGVCSGR
jgi:hypothetical protein